MLKAGIIGAGYIGDAHAKGYAALSNVQLSAVVDRNLESARRLAGQYQVQALDSLETLLASDVALVSICTPTPTHAELTKTLLRAGKHVLCEKPIARNLEQAQSMIDVARSAGTKLMIAHVSRYEQDHRKAWEVVQRGDLGELRMGFHSITSNYPGWSTQDWLGDATQSGGPVVDLAIHSVDYLLWQFGKPARRVYALGSKKRTGKDHYILMNVYFEGGGLGLIEASWAHPAGAPLACRVELCGTQGRIAWDYEQINSLRGFRAGTGKQDFILEGENSFADQINDFVRCIEQDLPSPVSGEQARNALQVCLAALESLETGRCVEITQQES